MGPTVSFAPTSMNPFLTDDFGSFAFFLFYDGHLNFLEHRVWDAKFSTNLFNQFATISCPILIHHHKETQMDF